MSSSATARSSARRSSASTATASMSKARSVNGSLAAVCRATIATRAAAKAAGTADAQLPPGDGLTEASAAAKSASDRSAERGMHPRKRRLAQRGRLLAKLAQRFGVRGPVVVVLDRAEVDLDVERGAVQRARSEQSGDAGVRHGVRASLLR